MNKNTKPKDSYDPKKGGVLGGAGADMMLAKLTNYYTNESGTIRVKAIDVHNAERILKSKYRFVNVKDELIEYREPIR